MADLDGDPLGLQARKQRSQVIEAAYRSVSKPDLNRVLLVEYRCTVGPGCLCCTSGNPRRERSTSSPTIAYHRPGTLPRATLKVELRTRWTRPSLAWSRRRS